MSKNINTSTTIEAIHRVLNHDFVSFDKVNGYINPGAIFYFDEERHDYLVIDYRTKNSCHIVTFSTRFSNEKPIYVHTTTSNPSNYAQLTELNILLLSKGYKLDETIPKELINSLIHEIEGKYKILSL